MTIVDALRDALQDPHAATSQERVHTVVARRLEELTERTSVRTTGYFNLKTTPGPQTSFSTAATSLSVASFFGSAYTTPRLLTILSF